MARARRHFAAIAAGSLVLTGGLAAYTATQTATAATTRPTPSDGTLVPGGNVAGRIAPGAGLTAPQKHTRPDAKSNAS